MSQSTESMSDFLDDLWADLRKPEHERARGTSSSRGETATAAGPTSAPGSQTTAASSASDRSNVTVPEIDAPSVRDDLALEPGQASPAQAMTPPAELTRAATIRTQAPEREEVPSFPPVPRSMQATGISGDWISRLILKLLAARGALQGRKISAHIRILYPLTETLLSELRHKQLVVLKGEAVAGDYTYVITERGMKLAREFSRECTYFGATPVPIRQYNEMMERQSVADLHVRSSDLKRAFSDLLVATDLLQVLGPAINSGRGLFLFGEPGNGKTSIAERVAGAFGSPIWIPRAVLADGHVIRVYDPAIHEPVTPNDPSCHGINSADTDQRWICVRRPTVVAGGELTMSELEVSENPASHISEAPLQLKSNGGVLLIDDFGRQRMPVDELLNRWIVPLEKRYDLLNLPNGKKIKVPFDQLVIFSTNLEPRDLVDDAFLRRIPYKVEVPNPTPEQFHKLFQIMCDNLDIAYRREAVDYLIHTHYQRTSRPLRACHPRDLLHQIRNFCLYEDVPMQLTKDSIDFAVRCYFSVLG